MFINFKVYEETLIADDGLPLLGVFTLDAPFGSNVWIGVHCADEADLDTIEVVSPSGRIFDLPLVSDGMLHIRIGETDEFGDWNYRLRFSQPMKEYLVAAVEVTAQASKVRRSHEEAVTVRAWNSIANEVINATEQLPILLYAQVSQGQVPILNAKVTAFVHQPNATKPVEVQLYDRGTGGT